MTSRRAAESATPLRIALIAPLVSPIVEPHLGGSQVAVSDLAQGLAARGHDVTLYAAEGSRIEGVTVRSLGIDAAALRADMYRPDNSQAPASRLLVDAYSVIYADIGRRRFDVLHNHGFDAPAITGAIRSGIPVLHTLHLPPAAAVAEAIAEARASDNVTRVFGVSLSHTASWQRLVRMDGTLANGVPVDAIPYSDAAPRVAVIAARFSPEKGMAEGIAAARGAGWPVAVYGMPYDAAYEQTVRDRWRGDESVQFVPALERRLLWRAFAGAGAVLCLSRWEEPFGLVAAEAQAAGTPVVATRCGGLVEAIRDGETGMLVELDDASAATAALDTMPSLSRRRCRHHALEHLNLPDSVARHEAVYRGAR
jgi:UDP-glucose:tetrahydrobiopterin glucosyltransferase